MDMSPHQSEWELRDLSEPLRQGDVLVWSENPAQDPWKKLGIVVTADCDLAQSKHRGVLSYCPVLTLNDFLALHWAVDDLEKQRLRYLEATIGRLSTTLTALDPKRQPITDQEVLSGWVSRRGAVGILQDVGAEGTAHEKSLSEVLLCLEGICRARESADIKQQLRALADARLRLKSSPNDSELLDEQRRVWDNYKQRIVGKLPGDLFFLSQLGPMHTTGYVVYLRRVIEIDEGEIAVTADQAPRRAIKRLSRIAAPFRYRITQKLAAVFADIGLPPEYETLSQVTIAAAGQNFEPVP